MAGLLALLGAGLVFAVSLAVPLFAQTWRSFITVVLLGGCLIGWLAADVNSAGSLAQNLGSFVVGLLLIGFSGGVIAKLAMLIGKPPIKR